MWVIDPFTPDPVRVARLEGHDGPIASIRFSHDGQRIVTTGTDDKAYIWSIATGQCLMPYRGRSPFHHGLWAEFAPDDHAVVLTSDNWPALVWNADTGASLLESTSTMMTCCTPPIPRTAARS